jgi:tRNA threonylcarbamoyladenosine biosynthesis protein TsaB
MSRILAIDTSGPVLGLCLLDGSIVTDGVEDHRGMRHTENLLPAIEALLQRNNGTGRVDAIAVASGPGSFTGLRIGMATAKGLASGWECPVISVDTLEGLAETEWALRVHAVAGRAGVNEVGTVVDRHVDGSERGFSGARRTGKSPADTQACTPADAPGDVEGATSGVSPLDAIIPILDARKSRYYVAVFVPSPAVKPSAGEPGTWKSAVQRETEDLDISRDDVEAIVRRYDAPCIPGPDSEVIERPAGTHPAAAAGRSGALGVAIVGARRFAAGVYDEPYHGPFYLRETDIGVRKDAPRFTPD